SSAVRDHCNRQDTWDMLAPCCVSPSSVRRQSGWSFSSPPRRSRIPCCRTKRARSGLEMRNVFLDEDLAIGTYRFAVSQAIPNAREKVGEAATDALRADIKRFYASSAAANTRRP